MFLSLAEVDLSFKSLELKFCFKEFKLICLMNSNFRLNNFITVVKLLKQNSQTQFHIRVQSSDTSKKFKRTVEFQYQFPQMNNYEDIKFHMVFIASSRSLFDRGSLNMKIGMKIKVTQMSLFLRNTNLSMPLEFYLTFLCLSLLVCLFKLSTIEYKIEIKVSMI